MKIKYHIKMLQLNLRKYRVYVAMGHYTPQSSLRRPLRNDRRVNRVKVELR